MNTRPEKFDQEQHLDQDRCINKTLSNGRSVFTDHHRARTESTSFSVGNASRSRGRANFRFSIDRTWPLGSRPGDNDRESSEIRLTRVHQAGDDSGHSSVYTSRVDPRRDRRDRSRAEERRARPSRGATSYQSGSERRRAFNGRGKRYARRRGEPRENRGRGAGAGTGGGGVRHVDRREGERAAARTKGRSRVRCRV